MGRIVALSGRSAEAPTDGKPHGDLTPREVRFVAALSEGATVTEAAKGAGISERSGWRWKADPRIATAVRARISEMLATARAVLAAGSARAARSLIAMTDGPGDAVNVAASRAVLEGATKLAAVEEISSRLTELEQRLAAGGRP